MTAAVSRAWTIGRPRLAWDPDGTPRSLDVDDGFASAADALGEARHVLLDGIGAPAVWDRPGPFTIAETGFGTGLNLLATWDLWRRTAPPDARPHWVSVEGWPLRPDEAARALARFPDLADLAATLLAAWPPPEPGLHVRALDHRVTLTLALGRADEALPALTGPVDAWALDGFAPARNPDLWSPAVYAEVARLSRPGARLATYTAAGSVRRGLEAAGFAVRRAPGFADKRECLRATFQGPAGTPPPTVPWAAPPSPAPVGARVAIIGAGLAGCAVAEALRRRGAGPVTVVDARGHPRDSRPAGLLGLLEPRLEKEASPVADLHAVAAPTAIALYDRLAREGEDPWRGPRGVMAVDRARRDDAWRAAVVARMGWPPDWLEALDARDAATRLGGVAPPTESALWHPRGGCLAPTAVLTALLADTPVRTAVVDRLEPRDSSDWILRAPDGRPILEADAVVITAATDTARLWPAARLPLRPTRGQISLLRAAGPDAPPRVAVSGPIYATPPVSDGAGGWRRILGATQVPWRADAGDPYAPRPQDDERLRATLATDWPALADALAEEPTEGALAGLRATTPDHLPLAGPLFDAETLARQHGEALRHGRRPGRRVQDPPGTDGPPGLYTLCGLGSHGLLLAPMMADGIAAQITGTPGPLPPTLAAAVHPARFTARALIRGRVVPP
ncbi:FAD-dependent 5-carboxymethylaminomethyl-2-thiouridine(34) oxidoreductase MnmC [Roseospira marina]|uniref:tRNA 5-methylaminomethyl-2-thiouridine biosynthesis bifunctional protein MnmC n=1 Tax=Roseospira marina TaxID=140057 RepID=A0A5M6IG76_9PROT|nr:FAD-dependent 5-carboxymethylaminomethyl-2-thiouridine(34) oxidoreductase MnmC [Roseospira marina]KAA5606887.1 FAD-dependent 5-carboxymethylaminomethyl-2-thiouridine(34) oxidoreductase MnmC [Roseospira marina]MBB4312942.1 tRNA 5-methylaminomethyl-2-thiouridine biosynthesis bifunctional protein [Roseospira marina]MBB5086285.1 tRNA 5-methylaminomethyl-2-thiouridine biosynthesis bifunctional protein [Roseospira marina]